MCADAKRLRVDRGEGAGSLGDGGCLTQSISHEQKGVKKKRGQACTQRLKKTPSQPEKTHISVCGVKSWPTGWWDISDSLKMDGSLKKKEENSLLGQKSHQSWPLSSSRLPSKQGNYLEHKAKPPRLQCWELTSSILE